MALDDNQFVFGQILGRNKPRLACAADTQAFTLAQRVKHQADVFANHFAFRCHHFAIIGRQVFLQKFAKRAFADKANAGTVFFGCGR